jgi:hypothetical protein
MTTINPATRPSNELNEFTRMVKDFFKETNEYGRKHYMVRLRDGTLIQPEYKEAEDEFCESAFFAEGYRYCWNLDGTSVTCSDYDMMEIVTR